MMDELYMDIFGSEELSSDPVSCTFEIVPCGQCEDSDTLCQQCESKWLLHARQCEQCKHEINLPRKSALETVSSNNSVVSTQTKPPWFESMAKIQVPSSRQINQVPQESDTDSETSTEASSEDESRNVPYRHWRKPQKRRSFKRPRDTTYMLEPDRPPSMVLLTLPKLDFVRAVSMKGFRMVSVLPYLNYRGIARTVYTLSYLRSTAHAVGVWAHCEHLTSSVIQEPRVFAVDALPGHDSTRIMYPELIGVEEYLCT